MRVKISFLRAQDSNNSVPLHHQKIVSQFIESIIDELSVRPGFYNFSSLKGTSKVQNGFMRFLSSKISLVVSSNNNEFIEAFVSKIQEKGTVNIGKLSLTAKSHQMMDYPDFSTRMKYVCISPLVVREASFEETEMQITDPSSHEFSDLLFHAITDRMEKAGFSDDELNEFAEFEVIPDRAYIDKIITSGKKFARQYKNNSDEIMMGYLLPFTLHAHPKVHKFIWDCGLGLFNEQGYGMVDVAKEDLNADQ